MGHRARVFASPPLHGRKLNLQRKADRACPQTDLLSEGRPCDGRRESTSSARRPEAGSRRQRLARFQRSPIYCNSASGAGHRRPGATMNDLAEPVRRQPRRENNSTMLAMRPCRVAGDHDRHQRLRHRWLGCRASRPARYRRSETGRSRATALFGRSSSGASALVAETQQQGHRAADRWRHARRARRRNRDGWIMAVLRSFRGG